METGTMDLHQLGAVAAAQLIADGQLSSEALVQACLARIETLEPEVGAWAFLDPAYALQQARRADERRRAGLPTGPLHGVPVGVKDIVDTADMPTENGTRLHAGRRPERDATLVARLRAAGAVILGKTVTTELACYSPGKTRNPHDSERTPGGSSSGSAAAVAAAMVPLAIGSQTNGSTIRPASFCGICGFKPSHGLISRQGVLPISRRLDHIGLFARNLEDIALLSEVLVGFDPADPDTRPCAMPKLLELARSEPPLPPRLALVRTPVWPQAEPATQTAFAQLAALLGDQVEEVELGGRFKEASHWHQTLMETDLALNFAPEYARGRDQLSPALQAQIVRGHAYLAIDYNRARAGIAELNGLLAELFSEFDAILTPATPGVAPRGLDDTGSPAFCTLWSLCGTPALSLPLLEGEQGLPLGVQLVAAKGDDGRLLRTARWLALHLEHAADSTPNPAEATL